MKKSIRITSLLLALLMLALPLVGCDRIDEMRAKQGFLLDKDTISFNGETYKRLYTNEHVVLYNIRRLSITDKDVPVLLSEWYDYPERGRYNIEENDVFIRWTHPDSPPKVYCRTDWYDSVVNALENGIDYNKCCYYHFSLDKADNVWKDMRYILTDEERAAIEDIIDNGVQIEGHSTSGDEILPIKYCTVNGFFEKESNIELLVSESLCYVSTGKDENKTIYIVPENYKAIFDNMLKAFRGSHKFVYGF